MELTFIRHAQSEPSAAGAIEPSSPLSDRGRQQTELLARSAGRWPAPHELLTSPFLRAEQTAGALAQVFERTPRVVPWLAEMAAGAAEPSAIGEAAIGEAGGESLAAFRVRVTTGLSAELASQGAEPCDDRDPPQRWRVRDEHKRLVLIGHGGSNALAIEWLLGMSTVPWFSYRLQSWHTAVARLQATPFQGSWVWGLVRLNHASHLPRALRSY